jgi:hypothetical protein
MLLAATKKGHRILKLFRFCCNCAHNELCKCASVLITAHSAAGGRISAVISILLLSCLPVCNCCDAATWFGRFSFLVPFCPFHVLMVISEGVSESEFNCKEEGKGRKHTREVPQAQLGTYPAGVLHDPFIHPIS